MVAQKPAGMTLAMHLCRGNFKSTLGGQGGYEPVAEALLSEMNVDAYFLEYDDDALGRLQAAALPAQGQDRGAGPGHHQARRAGERRTTSSAASTRRRSTCRSSSSRLSPQCGFSSTVHGNNIAVEAQRAKLRLVVETADEVWGSALSRRRTAGGRPQG